MRGKEQGCHMQDKHLNPILSLWFYIHLYAFDLPVSLSTQERALFASDLSIVFALQSLAPSPVQGIDVQSIFFN